MLEFTNTNTKYKSLKGYNTKTVANERGTIYDDMKSIKESLTYILY